MGLSFSVNDYLSVDSLARYYATKPTLGSMLLWDLAYWFFHGESPYLPEHEWEPF